MRTSERLPPFPPSPGQLSFTLELGPEARGLVTISTRDVALSRLRPSCCFLLAGAYLEGGPLARDPRGERGMGSRARHPRLWVTGAQAAPDPLLWPASH